MIMTNRLRVLLAVPALVALPLLAACGPKHGEPHLTASQQAALAPYKAVVEADVTKVGGPYALVTKHSARVELYTDLKHLVPKAQRQAFVNAATEAAVKDKVYHHAGRVEFIDVSLPTLLKQYGAHLS